MHPSYRACRISMASLLVQSSSPPPLPLIAHRVVFTLHTSRNMGRSWPVNNLMTSANIITVTRPNRNTPVTNQIIDETKARAMACEMSCRNASAILVWVYSGIRCRLLAIHVRFYWSISSAQSLLVQNKILRYGYTFVASKGWSSKVSHISTRLHLHNYRSFNII